MDGASTTTVDDSSEERVRRPAIHVGPWKAHVVRASEAKIRAAVNMTTGRPPRVRLRGTRGAGAGQITMYVWCEWGRPIRQCHTCIMLTRTHVLGYLRFHRRRSNSGQQLLPSFMSTSVTCIRLHYGEPTRTKRRRVGEYRIRMN